MVLKQNGIAKVTSFKFNLNMLNCIENRLKTSPDFEVKFSGSKPFAQVVSSLYVDLIKTKNLNHCLNVYCGEVDQVIQRLHSINQKLKLDAIPTK
jgi:hypothetical protein